MMAEREGPGNPPGKRAGRQPPWDKSGEAEIGSFGTWLRRQRELREISLRDVAERTKISLRYLEAMEEDRFDLLPAPVFAKGFLREYARYVGLSPDEVVNHWLAVQQAGERPEGEEASAQAGPRRRLSRVLVVLALLLLAALVAFGVYWQRHRGRTPAGSAAASSPAAPGPAGVFQPAALPAASAASAPPAATPPPGVAEAPSEAPPAPLEVTLDFSRECWVEALIDGKKRIAEQRVAGEALRLPAQQKVQLTLGDAGAAEVQVNGSPLTLPVSGKGQVLRDFLIDLDTLKTLKAKKETR
ncbi:MAG TPA: helix-turn-helix domain-containing protein [Thermoanaerobaculia bacterium]|nr:helix-turn-helix domain-containing protein [Thermoanaerobaculia bacterium]